jgi:energy-coupling factor transporter ATP-binding protein EcfA2
MRFADPDEGAIRFDGRDIRAATLASLRGQLGVVFQESFLFDATIRENIAMGKPNATDEEVEAAAKAAELHEFITELPRGYDTLVGERGGRLSGGQRQRLAIARALLRDPSVLILDEATSALDPRTERLIATTLERVGAGRTTIAVTHRLNSVITYDRIFVIVAGKLVEQGTHDELVRLGGAYAGLWAEQTGGGVAADAPFDSMAAVARVTLFAGLPPEDLALVAGRLRPYELASGERVAEGGGRLTLVRRGRATVLAPGLGGGEPAPVAQLGPGDAFGVSALLGQETGSTLSADGPVSLLVLDDESIAALAASLPAVGAALEGSRPPAVSPAGGRRLTRMTLMPGNRLSVVGAAVSSAPVPAGPSPDDVRRVTGTFGAVVK